MKALWKLLLCAAVAASLLPSRVAMALPDDPGFTIKSYDVHAVVSESNVYDVDETIQVNFTEQRHGIYRDIPVGDGSLVQDVSVDGSKYSLENDGQNVEIKIGDPDVLVQGDQKYKIHYTLAPGPGTSTDSDEMDYSIIGTSWDTTIDDVTFTVVMPKPFDGQKLGFTQGAESSQEPSPDHFRFNVDGNTISGELSKQLASGEGLRMHLSLPQGYFVPATVANDDAAPQAQVPSGGEDQIFPPDNAQPLPVLPGGLLLSGAFVGVFAFGGVVLVAVIVAVVLANRGRAPGGTVPNNPGMLQNMRQDELLQEQQRLMQQEELLREQQRRMQQDFTPPPPPPPPPSDMGGGFPGGGAGGGGGGSW